MTNPFDAPGSQIADEDAAQERRDADRWRHAPGPRIEYTPLTRQQQVEHEQNKEKSA